MSRSKMGDLVKGGSVRVNWRETRRTSQDLAVGDVIRCAGTTLAAAGAPRLQRQQLHCWRTDGWSGAAAPATGPAAPLLLRSCPQLVCSCLVLVHRKQRGSGLQLHCNASSWPCAEGRRLTATSQPCNPSPPRSCTGKGRIEVKEVSETKKGRWAVRMVRYV